ncbi:fungal-specific transcription factor domain-containing protein [Aspergillus multicolor]|uniref:C2H2-type zinc finger protein n=1 Tax=Aspergillus multicolor TaxID=41759 RepID=UPI003CCE2CAC
MEQVKPFACPACTGRFTRQENLNRHTASVHRRSNLRPFPCPQCDVSFSRSDLRKRHVRKYHLQETDPSIARFTESPHNKPPGTSTARPSTVTNVANISWLFQLPQFITAYFDKFQTILPLIHRPTFDASSSNEPLLQAVACIGAVYHSAGSHHEVSLALMHSGVQALDTYVEQHKCAGFRQVWVIQAYLLFEYFALHSCDDELFRTTVTIHRKLVDAARQYQLLQDSITLGGQEPLQSGSLQRDWESAIQSEARKRAMYTLYYLDAQMSVMCNIRPLLTALEVKYELPCRDDLWSAPNAQTWNSLLILSQDESFNNEHDDDDANVDPRPAQGDLYSSIMHLMAPGPPGKSLGLLWNSAFAALMLVMQIQMMVRDLILGSTFLYHNIRGQDENDAERHRHTLSIIPEHSRAQIMQALDALADLMPPRPATETLEECPVDVRPWNHIWIVWHYTALCLTHQDGLLTNGIVEYSLPTAISTAWELGKPRSKQLRDVYEDRDVIRVAGCLESILSLVTKPALGASSFGSGAEDPFITMVAFKAILIGWRAVRLMALGLQGNTNSSPSRSSIYTLSAKVLMRKILGSIEVNSEEKNNNHRHRRGSGGSQQSISSFTILNDSEALYLERVEAALARRNVWPAAVWIGAVFTETRGGMGI